MTVPTPGYPDSGIDHVQHATTVSLDFDFPDAGYFLQGTQRHRPVPGNRAQSLVVKNDERGDSSSGQFFPQLAQPFEEVRIDG